MEIQGKKINWMRVGINLGLPLFIFLFNLVLITPLLQGEFSHFLPSDQPVFIKAIHYIKESWPRVSWANFWQGGFSFPLFFSPFVPYVSQVVSFLGISAGQILRLLSGLAYALIPLSLYFFVKILTKRRVAAFMAAFAFSLLPSLNILFFSEIKEASQHFFHAPWHFIINTLGSTPHTLSLVFIPLTGAYFLYTLKKANFKKIIICSLLIVLTGLIDYVSLFSLLILLFVLMFSEVLLSDKTAQSRVGIFLICLIIAFGLSSLWYNPSFIKNFFTAGLGFEVGENLLKYIPYLILLIPWFLISLFYIFGYRKQFQSLFVAWSWFTLTFIICFSYLLFKKSFIPQAQRCLIEMNMAFSIILGVIATHFYDWLGRVEKKKHCLANFFRYLFVLGIILITVYYTLPFLRNAWQFNQNHPDITQERIYKISQWFNKNVKLKETRIHIPSPENKWFNIFAPHLQISNPLSESQRQNRLINNINNYWENTEEEEKSLMLAKATNTKYFVVPKDFKYKDKFENIGKLMGKIEGDKIFAIDLLNEDLIQKVEIDELSRLNPLDENLYKEDLVDYLKWQEKLKDKKVDYQVLNNHKIVINTDLEKNEGLLIKMNYDPGFKAKTGHENLEIKKDPLGFMVIEPGKEGKLEIELKYGLSLNQWIGIDITILTVFFLIIYRVKPKRKVLKREGQGEKPLPR